MQRVLQRLCQRPLLQEARSGFRSFSEASTSGRGVAGEAATARLFENVQGRLPEVEAAAAAAAESEPSTAGRVLSVVGNALFFGTVGASAFFGYYTLRYTNDQVKTMIEETQKPENSFPGSSVWSWAMTYYAEQRQRLESEVKKYSDPSSESLLPDLPPHARHVRTLVLDLDDTLVHSHWTRGRGWRTFKRPGAEDFIRHLAQFYELVAFTSQLPTYADPILDRLDPQRMIQFRLYRDSTQYIDGKHVRDLSKLNRDLSKVLLISADPNAWTLQPENAVKMQKWKLEGDDTKLLDLLPFLEAIFKNNVVDVRDVVKSYEGEDIPTAFRKRMERLADQQRQQKQQSKGFLSSFSRPLT